MLALQGLKRSPGLHSAWGAWPLAARLAALAAQRALHQATFVQDSTAATATAAVASPAAACYSPSTTATVLDGRRVAAAWTQELAAEVQEVTKLLGRPPGLSVINVGQRPDSQLYITRKQESCQKAGIAVQICQLPQSVTQSSLEEHVRQVCARPDVDAVLVQLPLPPHLAEEAVMERLTPDKDVDGFHPLNMGRMLMRGPIARVPHLVPCTALGVLELLERSGVTIRGQNAVVVGDSNVVGTPIAAMLRDHGAAAVTICHRLSYREWFDDWKHTRRRSDADVCLPRLPGPRPGGAVTAAASAAESGSSDTTPQAPTDMAAQAAQSPPHVSFQLPDITRSADILIVAVGHPELVRASWVKPGAVVVDIGINVVPLEAAEHHVSGPPYIPDACEATAPGACGTTPPGSLPPHDCGAVRTAGSPSCQGGQPPTHVVVGDVHFDEVSKVAGAITPVPGGVGPMTIAAVLHNTIKAARLNHLRRQEAAGRQ